MPGRENRKHRGRGGAVIQRVRPKVELNKDIRKYVTAARTSQVTESWASKPEIPSSSEIMGGEDDGSDEILLGANNIRGPWLSKELYLKTHYNLLREDSIAPLRDAVAYVRQTPEMKDTSDFCIYEKVHIVGMTCAQAGIAFRIQFSSARAGKKIVWEYSKRLTSGSIVALTPVNNVFRTKCILAIVAARPLDGLKMDPPEIDLFFARAEDAEFDYQQEWLMVEARSGYYEAARHTLTSLQKLSTESFPLSEHICGLKFNIEPPEYLSHNPIINMASVLADEACPERVNIHESWPSHPETLDASQWEAFQQILTKRLSIVQGPPGTGKTHVSVIALKALLANMRPGDPPLVIAAQTNHALDQLLRHIAGFQPNYVRLGGRSNDPEIKKHTLYELRQKTNIPFTAGGTLGIARKERKDLAENITELLAPLTLSNSGIPLQGSLFLKFGLITQIQYDSLINGAEGWIHSGGETDPISAWLGEDRLNFEVVYKTENFGFEDEEIDLEYEQLKELEAEQGLDDDDYENLKGQYTALKEGFVARVGNYVNDKAVKINYLKYEDMWKIPTKARGVTYMSLRKRAKEAIRESLQGLLAKYNKICVELKIGKWERDSVILQDSRLIGMTTTGLSKYRGLVSSIKPKIILIEEAAEVIEAPVAAACMDSLQHLILVGDHKQLQGNCSVQELEGEPFYLNVSMFERLVRNTMPFKRLTSQRRMAPEIRRILSPIYNDLHDHECVQNRPEVPGMGDVRSYFYCHAWPESSDSLLSKFNQGEAKMVIGFYVYLYMNGVPVEDITILTFYNGQRKKILKALKENPLFHGQYAKVATVDSYQGEENEIVLLSLVRSNEDDNIGFLGIENRVCVALSRAKRGFYIFGNAESLAVSSGLWWEVIQIMRKAPKRLGYYFPLTCTKHKSKTLLQDPETWKIIDGGCMLKCGESLPCGHTCPLHCHVVPHSDIQCQIECGRELSCGHRCTEICFRPCKCSCNNANLHTFPSGAIQKQYSPGKVRQNDETLVKQNTEEHCGLVQRYQKYATGGAKQDDIRLANEANRLALRQKLERMDEETSKALFGDGPLNIVNDNRTESKLVPDGEGGFRTKFTQFYSNSSPGMMTNGKGKGEECCLIDSLI